MKGFWLILKCIIDRDKKKLAVSGMVVQNGTLFEKYGRCLIILR